MRIIGGHDYYDSAQAFGQDKERVFVRKSFDKDEGLLVGEVGLKPVDASRLLLAPDHRLYRYHSDDKVKNRKGRFDFRPMVVWFAGVRHACVMVEGKHADQDGYMKWCAWSADELREFLASVESGFSDNHWTRTDLGKDNVDEWFAEPGTDAEKEWLVTKGVSIAISDGLGSHHGHQAWYSTRRWKIDTDGLKDLGFQCVLPPWEAFQRLDMWVGGIIARPGRPTVEIASDVVRRDKHGFDGMSFKKPKSQD
ncbi:hypothetical protein [Rhizobium sp. BK176]|uniref:hypothetical protein n=1 Tax=Rhizobium sp. BK176 TaxID=2587071 RepID=UPI002166ED8E|nr:hypothetical protein [Rhizobium sp. BK176]MCS4089013.1 hypothetical protein [Rhizobium sp. BK176]